MRSRATTRRVLRTLAINSNVAERYPGDSPARCRARHRRDWPHPFLYTSQTSRAPEARIGRPHIFVLDAYLELRYDCAPDSDYELVAHT